MATWTRTEATARTARGRGADTASHCQRQARREKGSKLLNVDLKCISNAYMHADHVCTAIQNDWCVAEHVSITT